MAIGIRSSQISQRTSNGTSDTITAPSSIVNGDILVLLYASDAGVTALNEPSGFNPIAGTTNDYNDGGQVSSVYTKTASGESGNYTGTHTTSERFTAWLGSIQDTSGIHQVAEAFEDPSTGTVEAAQVTTTVDGCLILYLFSSDDSTGSISVVGGSITGLNIAGQQSNNSGAYVLAAWEVQATAGTTTARTWSINAAQEWVCRTIAFAPTGGGTNGTAVSSFGALSAAASGTPTTFGTAATNFGGLTGTAAGTKTVPGAAVSSFGGLTAAASGGEIISGTAAGSFGALTATAEGSNATLGTAVSAFGGLTATGAGTKTVSGVGAAAFGGLTATAAGTQATFATAATNFGGLTAAGTGGGVNTGTAASAFGGLTAAAVVNNPTAGVAVGAFGTLTAAATGSRTVAGTAAAAFGGLAATTAGTRTTTGTAVSSFGALAATAAGTRTLTGTAAADFGAITATGSGAGTTAPIRLAAWPDILRSYDTADLQRSYGAAPDLIPSFTAHDSIIKR